MGKGAITTPIAPNCHYWKRVAILQAPRRARFPRYDAYGCRFPYLLSIMPITDLRSSPIKKEMALGDAQSHSIDGLWSSYFTYTFLPLTM